jgi:arylsulfatase A-like enzyme
MMTKSRRIYSAMASVVDESILNITTALKKHGMWQDTVLVYARNTARLGI